MTDYQQLEVLLEHRGDPWWEEVSLLYAGRVPDASALFQSLLGEESTTTLKEDIFWTNLLLAGRCLAIRPTIWQTALREEVITRLFRILTNTPYSLAQGLIANALAEIGSGEVNAQLVRLLADEQLDGFVRMHIADVLGQLGNDDTTVYALAVNLQKSDLDAVYTALWKVSHRLGSRVFLTNTPVGKQMELSKW